MAAQAAHHAAQAGKKKLYNAKQSAKKNPSRGKDFKRKFAAHISHMMQEMGLADEDQDNGKDDEDSGEEDDDEADSDVQDFSECP